MGCPQQQALRQRWELGSLRPPAQSYSVFIPFLRTNESLALPSSAPSQAAPWCSLLGSVWSLVFGRLGDMLDMNVEVFKTLQSRIQVIGENDYDLFIG